MDCPKCGRLVYVPTADGKVRPERQFEWDKKDPALARALNELASIGREERIEPQEALPNDAGAVPIGPVPDRHLPPIELPDPPPAARASQNVTMQPEFPASNVVIPESVMGGDVQPALAQPPHGKWKMSAGIGEPDLVELPVAPPAGGAVRGQRSPSPVLEQRGPRLEQRGPRTGVVLLFAGFCVGGALVAVLIGYELGLRREGGDGAAAGVAPQPTATSGTTSAPVAAATAPALTGRITYVNQSDEGQPDRGARVIVLPVQRQGTARISVVGFRPTDSDPDLKLATAEARALGGDLATAAQDGTFRILLPGAGEYQLLVLSHFQAREPSEAPATLRSFLESYFDRPDQLLGRFACQDARIRYKGTGTDVWDYAFAHP